MAAFSRLSNRPVDEELAHEALGDLERQQCSRSGRKRSCWPCASISALPTVICSRIGATMGSACRVRVAMYLVRRMSKLSLPGDRATAEQEEPLDRDQRLPTDRPRDHSSEALEWSSTLGARKEDAAELVQRLEEHAGRRSRHSFIRHRRQTPELFIVTLVWGHAPAAPHLIGLASDPPEVHFPARGSMSLPTPICAASGLLRIWSDFPLPWQARSV